MFTLNEMNVRKNLNWKTLFNYRLLFISIVLILYFLGFAKLQRIYAAWGCANKTGESACVNGHKTTYYDCVKADPGSSCQSPCDGRPWSHDESCSGGGGGGGSCDPNRWGGWGACSVSCGGGTQSRSNACGTSQSQACNTQTCVFLPTALPPTTVPPTVTPIPPTLTLTSVPPTVTPASVSCTRKSQGDANCDGKVDGIDYSVWLNSQCNPTASQTCANLKADYNADGKVNDDDYAVWFTNRNT